MLEDFEPEITEMAEGLYEAGLGPDGAMHAAWTIAKYIEERLNG